MTSTHAEKVALIKCVLELMHGQPFVDREDENYQETPYVYLTGMGDYGCYGTFDIDDLAHRLLAAVEKLDFI